MNYEVMCVRIIRDLMDYLFNLLIKFRKQALREKVTYLSLYINYSQVTHFQSQCLFNYIICL